ncbi:MAG: Cof-type HAD-IIB family hydrolase [Anaeroplasmataceae bacterium]|nr:Cof-type HAD-IIB family hydrolase [Anaeroplasmataceae bacterium]
MNKIFLFDVDGTLSVDGIVPNSAKDALVYLRNKGYLVLLCTGRCLGQMTDLLNSIHVDGIIANNGAYASLNGIPFFEAPIDNKEIKKLIDKKLCLGILTKDEYGVVLEDEDVLNEFCAHFKIQRPKHLDLENIFSKPIYSLGVYTKEDMTNTIEELANLHFVKVCEVGYDIVSKGISKATAIKALKKLYPDAKIIAFGDNYNDLEMFEVADEAYAMASAPKALKVLATGVTKAPLEDGILYAIKELMRL